jgi:hypothetical protein
MLIRWSNKVVHNSFNFLLFLSVKRRSKYPFSDYIKWTRDGWFYQWQPHPIQNDKKTHNEHNQSYSQRKNDYQNHMQIFSRLRVRFYPNRLVLSRSNARSYSKEMRGWEMRNEFCLFKFRGVVVVLVINVQTQLVSSRLTEHRFPFWHQRHG